MSSLKVLAFLTTLMTFSDPAGATIVNISATSEPLLSAIFHVDLVSKYTARCTIISGNISGLFTVQGFSDVEHECDGTDVSVTFEPATDTGHFFKLHALGTPGIVTRVTFQLTPDGGETQSLDVQTDGGSPCSANVETSINAKKLAPGESYTATLITANNGTISVQPGNSDSNGGFLKNSDSSIPYSIVDQSWDQWNHLWSSTDEEQSISIGPVPKSPVSGSYTDSASVTITCP